MSMTRTEALAAFPNLSSADLSYANLSSAGGIWAPCYPDSTHLCFGWRLEGTARVRTGCRDMTLAEALDHHPSLQTRPTLKPWLALVAVAMGEVVP